MGLGSYWRVNLAIWKASFFLFPMANLLAIVHQVQMDIGGNFLNWQPRIFSRVVSLLESPAMCQALNA
jgi:hypothetical protein